MNSFRIQPNIKLCFHLQPTIVVIAISALLFVNQFFQVTPASQATDTNKKNSQKSSKKIQRLLVPPPPPTVPLNNISLNLFGLPIEFMSPKELKKQQGEIASQIERATRTVGDQKATLDESKERASQFESLFSEGVVSKKELEQTKASIAPQEDQFIESQRRLTELQSQLNRVNTKLKGLTLSPKLKSKSIVKASPTN